MNQSTQNARTPLFLMANLGSELTRFFRDKEKGEREKMNQSAKRALGIIDSLSATSSAGYSREAKIWGDVVKDATSDSPQYHVSIKNVEGYFLPLASRLLSGVK
ncbi:MAG: hypothetical protein PHS53_04845 [Candidatus Pacebacteria bacterium]|nr:hypothetical protein [Candidatus Paceibacterota bacterium]